VPTPPAGLPSRGESSDGRRLRWRWGLHEPYPDGAEHPWGLFQDALTWVGDVEQRLGQERSKSSKSRVVEERGYCAAVTSENHRVQLINPGQQHRGGGVGCRGGGDDHLAGPSPGKALLGPPAGGAAAVHLT